MPWLPGIPHRLAADPDRGPYLNARSQLVAELADQVRRNTTDEPAAWAAQRYAPVPAELIADLQVWRAATQVDPNDLRPTGPPQLGYAARIFQQQLDKRLAAADTNRDRQWQRLLATAAPNATTDPFLPELEERLTRRRHRRSARAADPASDAERPRDVSAESVTETHSDMDQGPGSARPSSFVPDSTSAIRH